MWKLLSVLVALSVVLTLSQAAAPTGSVQGVVRFVDRYPQPETLQVTKDFDVCGTKKADETFIVSPDNKGLRDAVVTLKGGTQGKAPSPAPATIRQKGCRYIPHVQVVGPGTALEILNEDPLLHNVHARLEADTLFNLAQPKYLKVLKRTLEKPGIVHVTCDVHAWMDAYIVVTAAPRVALTDEKGRYRFDGIPAGQYQVGLWHEGIGSAEKEVVVSAGKVQELNFEIGE